MACQAIANIVKSSLGPVGLDKVRIFLWRFFFLVWLRLIGML
jgi:chaperonin GroEL (HSP60 family)